MLFGFVGWVILWVVAFGCWVVFDLMVDLGLFWFDDCWGGLWLVGFVLVVYCMFADFNYCVDGFDVGGFGFVCCLIGGCWWLWVGGVLCLLVLVVYLVGCLY